MLQRTFLPPARRTRRVLLWTLGTLGAIAVALLFAPIDRLVYPWFFIEGVRGEDWHQVLRQVGYIPTWIIIALIAWRIDAGRSGADTNALEITPGWPPRPAHHRAGLLFLAAGLGGLFAEVLKPIIGRSRPNAEGVTHFLERPMILFADGGDIGYGLPSSHTAVAFGGMAMLAMLEPRIRVIAFALAAGCGISRMNAGAHALSDVLLGALVAIVTARLLFRAGQGPRRGPAGGLVPLH
ncbi:MAG: phosphatase PAP2 family protein [Planctomycetota bacterium]